MPSLGPAEILVILVVALLVFGPNKMPEIAKQVGKGFREFRRVQQHLHNELRDVVAEFDSPTVEQQAVPMLPPKDDATPAPEVTPRADATPAAPPEVPSPAAAEAPAPPETATSTAPSSESDAPSAPA